MLHLIDGLGGGGSEEWVKEIVRLARSDRLEFCVCATFTRDDVHAQALKAAGARVVMRGLLCPQLRRALSWIAARGWPGRAVSFAALRLLDVLHLSRLFWFLLWNRFDVIHVSLYRSLFYAILLRRVFARPGLIYQIPGTLEHLSERTPWAVRLIRRGHKRIDRFFTGISAEELESLGTPREKIRLLRGHIDIAGIRRVAREENPVIAELDLADAHPILLSVGRLAKMKGHAHALRSALRLRRDFPRVKFIVLGEGEERANLEREARQAGAPGVLLLPGFRSDVQNFFSLADAYMRVGLLEGGNRACYTAMAYGVPVVGFDTKCASENIRHKDNGMLVPTGDHAALADAIRRILTDEMLREKLSRNARADAEQHYDISRAIRDLEQAYEELAGRGGTPA